MAGKKRAGVYFLLRRVGKGAAILFLLLFGLACTGGAGQGMPAGPAKGGPGTKEGPGKAPQTRFLLFEGPQLLWPDSGAPEAGSGAGGNSDTARLFVLPLFLTQYDEKPPCDSCHRLSAEGFEFALDHHLPAWFHRRLAAAHPRSRPVTVASVSLHSGLLREPGEADSLALSRLRRRLLSLALPAADWFPPGGEAFALRRGRPLPEAGRALDSLAGRFGADYLLLPFGAAVDLRPRRRDRPKGGLRFSFYLALWNAARSRPEWAIRIVHEDGSADLDRPLEPLWDKALERALGGVPAALDAYRRAEPR